MEAHVTYNAIFGRPLLNIFRAVVLTYHKVIKFSASEKKITIKENLSQSRAYIICDKWAAPIK